MKQHGEASGGPEEPIVKGAHECAHPIRTRVEGVEDLRQHHGGEDHRAGGPDLARTAEHPTCEFEIKRDKSSGGSDGADEDDRDQHRFVDHPIGDAAWPCFHHVLYGRVNSECQCQCAVGDEVDPQDLSGQQWYG